MTDRRFSSVVATIIALAATALAFEARAVGLDPQACELLKTEYTRLNDDAMRADLGKGAEWGKANLSEQRLREIKHFIETEEQFLFRCPQPKPVVPPGTLEVDGVPVPKDATEEAAATTDEGPIANPGHVPDGAVKQPKPAKPAAAQGASAGTGTSATATKKPASKPAAGAEPPAKPKVQGQAAPAKPAPAAESRAQ